MDTNFMGANTFCTWVEGLIERVEKMLEWRCTQCGWDCTGQRPDFCPKCGSDLLEVIEEEEPKEPDLSTKENFYDRYIEDKKNGYRADDD